MEFYATINSLSDDGLLKKTFNKNTLVDGGTSQAGASDDLTSVFFKCNFDYNFIQEVAKKVNFILDDFLLSTEGKETWINLINQ